MEIRYFLGVIRAHFWFVVIVTVMAGATALLATYVLPEKYEASTLILIRPQPQRNFASTTETKSTLDYPVSFNIPPESVSQTYGAIMTSPAVAKRVVEILGLDRSAPPEEAPFYTRLYRSLRNTARRTVTVVWDFVRYGRVEDKDPYWKAVEDVIEGLEATPVEDTYIFKLTAAWREPGIAAHIADTAAKVFIEYTLDARRSEESAAVVTTSQRLDRVQADLDAARDRLRAFESQNQVAVPNRRLELKLDALTQVEELRDEVTRQLAGAGARIVNREGLLAGEPVDVQTSTTLARNEFLNGIRTELASDERKLAEREQTMTAEHPEVRALRARIAASSKRIAEEEEMIRLRDESARNPIRDTLRKELFEDQTTMEALKATARELDRAASSHRQSIDALVDRRSTQEQLAFQVSVLQDEYEFVNREHAEALLAVAQELSDIRALAPAIPPLYPSSPIKIFYLVLGLACGFFGAVGLVLVADYAEPRVRSGEDIERLMGVPVVEVSHAEARTLRSAVVLADHHSSSGELWRLLAVAFDERRSRDDR